MHSVEHSGAPAPLSRGYCALKWLAIAMGVLLVGGVLVMFGFMAKQMKSGSTAACEPTTINASPNDELIKIEEKDDTVTLWLKDPGQAIVIRRYAMCDGKILRDVRMTGGKPPMQQGQPGQPDQPPMPPQAR